MRWDVKDVKDVRDVQRPQRLERPERPGTFAQVAKSNLADVPRHFFCLNLNRNIFLFISFFGIV